jgi:hypothetical protein
MRAYEPEMVEIRAKGKSLTTILRYGFNGGVLRATGMRRKSDERKKNNGSFKFKQIVIVFMNLLCDRSSLCCLLAQLQSLGEEIALVIVRHLESLMFSQRCDAITAR